MDLGLGTFPADVDDGLAFILAAKSPELEIVGVSCVYGNVKMDVAFKNTKKLLEFFPDLNIKPKPGARSAKELGQSGRNPAVDAMSKVISANPGEITLVALGPLTNVARLLQDHTELESKIARLVIMGGSLYRQRGREFNFANDAKATQTVLNRAIPTTVLGLDVCCAQQFTNPHFDQLRHFAVKDPLGKYLLANIRKWLIMNKLMHGARRSSGFYPFDPVAVAVLLDPNLFKFVNIPLKHTLGKWPLSYFSLRTYIPRDKWVEGINNGDRESWVNYAIRIESKRFMNLLLSRITC